MTRAFTFLLIMLAMKAGASGPQKHIQQGNEYYIQGDYEKAIEQYESVLDSGYAGAGLYYNLGNAYYRSRKLPMALVNYERGRLLDPDDPEIRHNLEMARELVVDEIEALPVFFARKWIDAVVQFMGVDFWAIVSLSVFVLALIFFLIFFFATPRRLRKIAFWTGILCLVIALLSGIFAGRRKYMITGQEYAVILAPSVTVKSTPDESGTDLFQLHEGTRVTVIDSLSDWRDIRIADGNRGWVEASGIVPL